MTANTPKELSLSVNGLRLAALEWGASNARPVLALHGWLDNAASFIPLAAELNHFRLVALDLPGHGRSCHRPAGTAYHVVDWVVDVVGAADALGWDKFSIVGHSMGAGIGGMLAGTCPERVLGLVMLDGLGPFSAPPLEAPGRLAAHLKDRERNAQRKPRIYPDEAAMVARLLRVTPHLSAENARLLIQRGSAASTEGLRWSADPRLRRASPLRLTEEQVQAFFRRIECPCLLAVAESGYPYDAAMISARRQCIRQLEVIDVEGGHHLHMEHPVEVGRVINSFFAAQQYPVTQPPG